MLALSLDRFLEGSAGGQKTSGVVDAIRIAVWSSPCANKLAIDASKFNKMSNLGINAEDMLGMIKDRFKDGFPNSTGNTIVHA